MSEDRKNIRLSDSIQKAMAFDDPRMSDAEFEERLVDEIFHDDWAIRTGTLDPNYRNGIKALIKRDVAWAIKEKGLEDRNGVITAAYNKSSSGKPHPNFPKDDSYFLNGSDYLEWAKKETARVCKEAHERAKEWKKSQNNP
ncbi:MAG: hypothetical protein ACK4PK_00760 [Alphaproteobacteria bacterium]